MSIYNRKVKVKSTKEAEKYVPDESIIFTMVYEKYFKHIMVAFALIIIGILGWSGTSFYKKTANESISDRIYFEISESASLDTIKAIESKVKNENGLSFLTAAVQVAEIYYNKGEFEKALELYEKIGKNAKNATLRSIGLLGKGNTLAAKKDFEKAIQVFTSLKEANFSQQYNYLAEMAIARCHVDKGSVTEALKIYQSIKETYKEINSGDVDSKILALQG